MGHRDAEERERRVAAQAFVTSLIHVTLFETFQYLLVAILKCRREAHFENCSHRMSLVHVRLTSSQVLANPFRNGSIFESKILDSILIFIVLKKYCGVD